MKKQKEYEIYTYSSWYTPQIGAVEVFVSKENRYPDPLKKMIWGTTRQGTVISDYKRYFRKKRGTVIISFGVPRLTSVLAEKTLELRALEEYLGEGKQ